MKDLRRWTVVAVGGLALATFLPFSAAVADDDNDDNGDSDAPAPAQVYVVHGIPGADLNLDPALPVDVLVNDELCVLQGFTFGTIAGPLPLGEGTYNLKISLANETAPCSNEAVLQADVPFLAGESSSVVAYLTEGGAPTAGKFVNDLSKPDPAKGRIIVQHTAAAPTVDVKVTRRYGRWYKSALIEDLSNGQQASQEFGVGKGSVSILPANSMMSVFGPAPLKVLPYRAYLVYAVGNLNSGTFTLLVKEVMTQVGSSDEDDDDGERNSLRMSLRR